MEISEDNSNFSLSCTFQSNIFTKVWWCVQPNKLTTEFENIKSIVNVTETDNFTGFEGINFIFNTEFLFKRYDLNILGHYECCASNDFGRTSKTFVIKLITPFYQLTFVKILFGSCILLIFLVIVMYKLFKKIRKTQKNILVNEKIKEEFRKGFKINELTSFGRNKLNHHNFEMYEKPYEDEYEVKASFWKLGMNKHIIFI